MSIPSATASCEWYIFIPSESEPQLCSECLIAAVKKDEGKWRGGGECFHQLNVVSIFLFRQGASARADEVQRDGKESLGTLQLA